MHKYWFILFLVILGITCLFYWNKKINSATTWEYGIYILIIIMLVLFVWQE